MLAQGTEPSKRTINVTGTGKVTLTPDIAYVSIGVHTEGKDAAEAVATNTSQSQKVVDALKTFKIDPKDIQTTNFSIYPQQQYDNEGKPQGITYVVDNTVYVTLRDIDQLGELLDAVVKAGSNSINSIQFDVADREAALSEARQLAVDNAQKQAEELAICSRRHAGPGALDQFLQPIGAQSPCTITELVWAAQRQPNQLCPSRQGS